MQGKLHRFMRTGLRVHLYRMHFMLWKLQHYMWKTVLRWLFRRLWRLHRWLFERLHTYMRCRMRYINKSLKGGMRKGLYI